MVMMATQVVDSAVVNSAIPKMYHPKIKPKDGKSLIYVRFWR